MEQKQPLWFRIFLSFGAASSLLYGAPYPYFDMVDFTGTEGDRVEPTDTKRPGSEQFEGPDSGNGDCTKRSW